MSFLDDMLNGKIEKEAAYQQGENAQDHADKKLKASNWIGDALALDPVKVEKEYQDNLAAEARVLGKTAAYEIGDSVEETLKKDYARDVKVLSDYALAEMLMDIRGHKAQNLPEMAVELKEEAKKDVASNREKCEKEVLDSVGTSAQVDWKKEFARYSKEAKPEEPKEKDLYQPIAPEKPHEFQKPTEDKFKVPADQEKAIPGNGREADERTDVTRQAGVLHEDITKGLGKVAELINVTTSGCIKLASTTKKVGAEEITTTNFADFGSRERGMVRELLNAWDAQGLPEDFYDEGVHPMMNKNSGNVFLTNSEYQVAMLNGDKLESFYNCPECGHEGFKDEMQHEGGAECQRYLKDIGVIESDPNIEASLKIADKVKDSPANDKGNLAMPEGKKSAGDKPEEAVDGTTLPPADKVPGDKSDQAAEANSPEKGDKAKYDEAVNKEAHCGQCPGDPGHEQVSSPLKREEIHATAEMCPVCGSEGKDLNNGQKDHMSCMACGISYGHKEGSCGHCGSVDIASYASKEDVIKIIKTAEVSSPWQVIKDESGQEVIARVTPELNKESEEVKVEELKK